MNNSDELFPILELGSTYARLGIFNKLILNTGLYFEKKIDFTRDNLNESHKIFNLITAKDVFSGIKKNHIFTAYPLVITCQYTHYRVQPQLLVFMI